MEFTGQLITVYHTIYGVGVWVTRDVADVNIMYTQRPRRPRVRFFTIYSVPEKR